VKLIHATLLWSLEMKIIFEKLTFKRNQKVRIKLSHSRKSKSSEYKIQIIPDTSNKGINLKYILEDFGDHQ
jgi:hypothetical protein